MRMPILPNFRFGKSSICFFSLIFFCLYNVDCIDNSPSSSSLSSASVSTASDSSAVAASVSCIDSDAKCPLWAGQGECQSNAVWMMANCRRSCQSCQGGDKAWQLRQYLSKNYNISATNTTTKIVRIESVRINHVEVDESKQLVRTFGRMVMSWNDSKVAWDKQSWGISWLNFYWIQVWTPQIVQINVPNSAAPAIITGKVLAANHTGQMFMWIDFNFVAPYNFVYNNYPNDYQRICYKFDDKRYFSVRFIVSNEVQIRQHEAISDTHTTGWTLSDLQMTHSKYVIQVLGDWKQNPFDIQTNNCEMCLVLRRNAVFYFSEMLCPALVNTMLTLSASLFHLSSSQLILLAFSILSQLLSMKLLNSRLPSFTNSTPAILRYAGFNLASTAFLFFVSLALKRFAYAQSNIPLPHYLESFLVLADKWLPFSSFTPSNGGKNLVENSNQSSSGIYSEAAHILNRLIFAFFTLIYVLNILCTFIFV